MGPYGVSIALETLHECVRSLPNASTPAFLAASPIPGWSDSPMNYLQSFGTRADEIARLLWALLTLSIGVVVIITILTIAGIFVRATRLRIGEGHREPVVRRADGLSWLIVGGSLSTLALAGAMAWSAYTMASIDRARHEPTLSIEVTGHQWWWQIRYLNDDPSRIFETANEIHIPVGEPVRFLVRTADVIHSFWIPALGGKIDLIPNQTNVTWLEASKPGVYRGQCGEYCGRQHAHMAILVVADEPSDFSTWLDAQRQPARVTETVAKETDRLFIMRCGACHSVRGTIAGGILGPDLTHVMSRKGLAANTLPNTVANLAGWIANPQTIKPGSLMPNLALTPPELTVIRHYLTTLQ